MTNFMTDARLRAALDGELEPDERFRTAILLAGRLGQRLRAADAVDVLEAQLDALAARPDLRRAAEAALVSVSRTDPVTRARVAGLADDLRRRVLDGGESDPAVLGTVAAELALAGQRADRTTQLAERALHASARGSSWFDAVRALIATDHYATAARELEHGDPVDALTLRSELRLRAGDVGGAEADARALDERATQPLARSSALACLVEALVERGALEEAAALPPAYPTERVLLARGRLRLAQGRVDDAVDDLRECGRRAPGLLPWRSLLAHALLEQGQSTKAWRLAADELARARRFGAPRAIGVALRAAARAAGGDDEIRLLREATEVLDGSEAQLERARAHATLGAALRRAGEVHEAREALRAALDLAHGCGATVLERRTLTELRAAGARPRRLRVTGTAALTGSERRIAELAAAGHRNREIAETLVVTLATVEYHLRHTYRKLGIAGRAELGTALTA
jgi:DNA-binding CsgD family transcriptional regulator